MKRYLFDIAIGIPLAIGAMFTLLGVSMVIGGQENSAVEGVFAGLIGIPILFATIFQILRR
jgi:hypothetical protein